MKLSLTKKDEKGKRLLALDLTPAEDKDRFDVIQRYISGGGKFRREVKPTFVRYLLPYKYLEAVLLTFPYVDLSRGLEAKVMRAETIEYKPSEIPEVVIEGFTATLHDFQKVSVAELIYRQIPLEDGLGLGKTLQALAVVRARAGLGLGGTPCLVVCPNSAKWVWKMHIERYTDLSCMVVEGTALERRLQIDADAHITIINFEALRLHPELADIKWETVICDEFHRLKNPETQVTQAFLNLKAKWWLPMSGTPILNRVEESWTILHRLWPKLFPSYWAFCQNLVLYSRGTSGVKVGYRWRKMKKLRTHLHDNSIRRRKEQVIKDLPREIPITKEFSLTKEQRTLYDQILQEGKLQLASGGSRKVLDMRTLFLRLRQATFSPELYDGPPKSAMVEEVKLLVAELVANHEKAIIFNPWSRATRILERELQEYNPAYVDGSVSTRKKVGGEWVNLRQQEAQRFNEDPSCHLYIGTIGANREAISLGAGTYVIMTGEEWSPLANDQAIGRSAAGGLRGVGAGSVTIIRMYARDTIEEKVMDTLRAKRQEFQRIFEHDGGKASDSRHVQSLSEIFMNA